MLCQPVRRPSGSQVAFSLWVLQEWRIWQHPMDYSQPAMLKTPSPPYGGPLTSSSPWINGPRKGPWRPPLKHHRPFNPSSLSVSTQMWFLAGVGPGTNLSSIGGQPPYPSHAGSTSGSYGNNGSDYPRCRYRIAILIRQLPIAISYKYWSACYISTNPRIWNGSISNVILGYCCDHPCSW